MKVIRNTLQGFRQRKEKEPRDQKTKPDLNHPRQPAQRSVSGQIRSRDLCETSGAKYTIIVLRDALAAEISDTTRTARRRLPCGVIEAALVSKTTHI
jgi:hypothetical protein